MNQLSVSTARPGRSVVVPRACRFGALGLVLTLLLLGMPCPCLAAATNAPAGRPANNRFLVIMNVSEAMKPRAPKMLEALQRLLDSDMEGRLRTGDILGLWTYNSQLNAGQFPVQQWSPARKEAIKYRFVNFLTQQPLEDKAKFAEVMPKLKTLAERSRYLTVILFSDGYDQITGTPFDEKIAREYDAWKSRQKKAKQPIITVLGVRDGQLVSAAVAACPWPADLPPVPPEPEPVAAKPAAPARKSVPLPLVATNSLIISGKSRLAATNPPAAAPAATAIPTPLEKPPAAAEKTAPPAPTTPSTSTEPASAVAPPPPGVAPIPQTESTPPAPAPAAVAPVTPAPEPKPSLPAAAAALSPATGSGTPPPERAQQLGEEPTNPPATPSELAPVMAASSASRGWPVRLLFVGGAVLVALALGAFLFLRRSRRAAPGSLITRSLDHKP